MSDDDDKSITMPTNTSEWMGISSSQASSVCGSSGRRNRSSRSRTSDSEYDIPTPSIKALKTKDYSNVSRLAERDHLNDDNWHEWKDRMLRVLYNSDIAEYVSGFIKRSVATVITACFFNFTLTNANNYVKF